MPHVLKITVDVDEGVNPAVLATDIKEYVPRRGGRISSMVFEPALTPEIREEAQAEVLKTAVDCPYDPDCTDPQHHGIPDLRLKDPEPREGESETEFSERLARTRALRSEARKNIRDDEAAMDPIVKFKGVFGDGS